MPQLKIWDAGSSQWLYVSQGAKGDTGVTGDTGVKGDTGVNSPTTFELKVFDDLTAPVVGNGAMIICIPPEANGMNLVDADAFLTTVATGASLTTIQIRNVTDAQDMLTTRITIDASEYTSYTALTQPVVNTTYDDIATGDLIAVDVDVIGNTTAGKGLGVILVFQLP